jgi:tetratricopeptide (TPR) repeat protein
MSKPVFKHALAPGKDKTSSISKNPFIKKSVAPKESVDGLLAKALEFHTSGQIQQAAEIYLRALKSDPNNFNALHLLGVTYSQQAEYSQAVNLISKAIQINPSSAVFFSNLGVAYRGLKDFSAAEQAFIRAVLLDPCYADAYNNRGLTYFDLQNFALAEADYKRTILLSPNHAHAHNNLGLLCKELHAWEVARAHYGRAIELNPDYAEAHWNRSILNLTLGELEAGFKEYEWRWKNTSSPVHRELRSYPQAPWLGNDALGQQTLLIYSEQGLGDTIQFSRYLKPLVDLDLKIIFQCPEPLRTLVQTSFTKLRVIGSDETPVNFDRHCPLMSLPLALMNMGLINADSESAQLKNLYLDLSPYLHIKTEQVHIWRDKLLRVLGPANNGQATIGFLNKGNPLHPNDRFRSIAIEQFLTYLPSKHRYINLSKELSQNESSIRADLPQNYSFANEMTDFQETAALCKNLDLCLTVDTSVAHLSAALGIKTWLFIPYSNDWRWQVTGESTPWYPSIKIYRQRFRDDWDELLSRVAVDLSTLEINHR